MSKKYRQGVYKPKNPEKYLGNHNPIYRSGWEKRFMYWADTNTNVLEWSSENVVIPYKNPLTGTIWRYYVDNYVKVKEGNKIVEYLIEIKPAKSLVKPTKKKNQKNSTLIYEAKQWVQNQAKWKAAKAYAEKNGMEFKIITEKELGIR